ncbi:MAG: hypothetical protein ACPGUY_05730, partial [Akkermansiaceae bacterium]
ADPAERHDLSKKHPSRLKHMLAHYDAWFTNIAATREDTFAPPRIVIGTPHETHTRFTKQDWLRTAGQGWGALGHWMIEAKMDKTYTAHIHLSGAAKDKKTNIIVHAGAHQFPATIPAGKKLLTIHNLKIPQGKYQLSVTTSDGKPVPHFHQLHLVQK